MSREQSAPTAAVSVPTPGGRYRRRATLVAAAVVPLALAAALVPVRAHYASPAAALTMVVVITLAAVIGDRVAGVVASISAALWFDFFYTRPYDSFTINHRPDVETTIAILVVGVVITELAGRSRHHFAAANEAYDFVGTIRDVAEAGARGAGDDEVDRERLRGRSRRCSDCATAPSSQTSRIRRSRASTPTARWCTWGWSGRRATSASPDRAARSSRALRGRVVGRFVLTPSTALPVSRERRIAAVSVVDAAAAALAAGPRA